VKAVEEMYAPVSGVVTARNDVVIDRPELLQQDPYGEGWLLEVEPTDPAQIDDLMAADAYRSKVEGA
jgi:glycine cleavage system H protein